MSFRTTILTALAVLTICLASTDGLAQGHTIRGKVRSSSGVNVGRASIMLEQNGAMVEMTVANNEGDFTFSGLSDTSYTLVVSAPDYNPASESVNFVRATAPEQPGELRTVEITLSMKEGVRPPRGGLSFVQDVPKPAREAFESGVKLTRNNRIPEAVAAYEHAITAFPDYFDAHFILAAEFAKQGKFAEAIPHLDEARRINPKDDRVYALFARVMLQQGKFAVAARIYAEAARLNPGEPQYLLAQGTALIEQASTIDPAHSKAAADQRSYALTEAETVLARAHQVSGKKLAAVHLQLARLYEKRGDRARAADELEQYLRQSPDDKKATEIRDAIKKLRAPLARN